MIFLIITQIRSSNRSRSFISSVNFEYYAVELSRVDKKEKFPRPDFPSAVEISSENYNYYTVGVRGCNAHVISQQFHLFTL